MIKIKLHLKMYTVLNIYSGIQENIRVGKLNISNRKTKVIANMVLMCINKYK